MKKQRQNGASAKARKGRKFVEELRKLDAAVQLPHANDDRLVELVRSQFEKPIVKIIRPDSAFPQLVVEVPDSWPHVLLAPLYDVHIGNAAHDGEMFARHMKWMYEYPYVLTWDGGDMIENASKLSVGAGVYEQDFSPQNQLVQSVKKLARIHHKLLFKLPGNHEDRTGIMGVDVGQWLAWLLDIPYFPDFCFLNVKFRGNNFRVCAHHGTGAAQTAGAQRMAARKDVPGIKPIDVYWTGHLHTGLVDPIYQTDVDQKTGEMFERSALAIISPSYVRYFGTYAAKKRYPIGSLGLTAVQLNPDGRIDASVHARGRRL